MVLIPTLPSTMNITHLCERVINNLSANEIMNLFEAIGRPDLISVYSASVVKRSDQVVRRIAKYLPSGFAKIDFLLGINRYDLLFTIVYRPIEHNYS